MKPPASWGKVLGIVSAKAADGSFTLWLEATNRPLTLIVARDGYRSQTRVVAIAAGKRTTANFTLVKP